MKNDPFEYHKRAQSVIAHGALTNSKRPETFIKGVYPTHLARGKGAFVWDTNGQRYLDLIGANGTSLFGYAWEGILQAVNFQHRLGSLLSLGSKLEVEAAEKLQQLFPFVKRLRFLKTGSEACSAALTIARAATGRKGVLSMGYHGWHQEFTSLTKPAHGIPQYDHERHIYKWDGNLDTIDRSYAAVIIEPVELDWSDDRRRFLQELREHCMETQTVLIFDEVITGFRFPRYSVSEWAKIRPDLIILGKAMAGGLPLAVVGGQEDIMECEDEYFVSSTYAGDTLALAAFVRTCDALINEFRIDELWAEGQNFIDHFNLCAEGLDLRAIGYPTRGVFQGADRDLFYQEACKAGVLVGPSWFYNFAHMEHDFDGTMQEILWKVKQRPKLMGESSRSPFASQLRSQ